LAKQKPQPSNISRAEQISGRYINRYYQRPMVVVAVLLALVLTVTIALTVYSNSTITGEYQGTIITLQNPSTVLLNEVLMVIMVAICIGILLAFLIKLMQNTHSMEVHLYHISNYDMVTGLLNRNFFFTYMADWSKEHISTTATFGLLFIDLDNFKSVNDKIGHDAGDTLLKLIADFLMEHTQQETEKDGICGLTARIGGDEFLMIVPEISLPEELESIARTMLEDFSKDEKLLPFITGFDLGMSIGGALFPSQNDDYNELVKLADIAMYRSKDGGKNNYTLYDEAMGQGTADMVLTVRSKK